MQTSFSAEQLKEADIASSEQILRKCVHCGFCTATCPTYVLLGDELDSPRGRIYLIKEMLEQSQPATTAVVRHIDRCLSCLACMTTCPSGVHYQHLIDHARVHVERTYRRPWRERALRALLAWTLPYPRRLRAALDAATAVHGLARLAPRSLRVARARIPASARALLELTAPRRPRAPGPAPAAPVPPANARRGRVGLLTGCVQSVLAPQIEAASTRLLQRAGMEVVRIEGCCGALVHHLGRAAQGRTLAASILSAISLEQSRGGLDAVIAIASGCGTHLKDYGFVFREDPELARPAAAASALVRDITEWLHEAELPRAAPGAGPGDAPPEGLVVAYHSACSMQHGQKLHAPPRQLLARAGFAVQEIPEGHLCCGSAGSYNILQPELAARLRDRKLENIGRTGATVVATGNIGCMVQLTAAGSPPIVHTVELLDWASGGPRPAALG
jgi:glycolate oxidase iron-sulfur subunit